MGRKFSAEYRLAFERYPKQFLWTEELCFLAEEYEADFENQIQSALAKLISG